MLHYCHRTILFSFSMSLKQMSLHFPKTSAFQKWYYHRTWNLPESFGKNFDPLGSSVAQTSKKRFKEYPKGRSQIYTDWRGIKNINISRETSRRPKQADPSTRKWTSSSNQPLKAGYIVFSLNSHKAKQSLLAHKSCVFWIMSSTKQNP